MDLTLDPSLPGIYSIINQDNGKCYIGSSNVSIRGRWDYHKYHLRKGNHVNSRLQNSWNL